MMSQTDRNATQSPRPVRLRRASAASSRRLRLEPLERRCALDAAGFVSLMGPIDLTSHLSLPQVTTFPAIESYVGEASSISIEPYGPAYPQYSVELPAQRGDFGAAGDGDGLGEQQEETPHSEDNSTDTPLIGSEAGSTESGDTALSGSGDAVGTLIGDNDAHKNVANGLGTALKLVRFVPLRGPSRSIAMDQDNLLDRETSGTGSAAAGRNQTVSLADLTIEVNAETLPKPRSEVSLTKTRYFEKESSGSLQESSLHGFRRQATSLRMFARQSPPEEAGISIGLSSADHHRRRLASWKSKPSLQSSETAENTTPPTDAAVALDDANTDLAIMEWVRTSIGNAKSLTSLSPTLPANGLIGIENIQPGITRSEGKEKASDETKAIALSEVTQNLGRFAVLGMLVSHGLSSKVRRRFAIST